MQYSRFNNSRLLTGAESGDQLDAVPGLPNAEEPKGPHSGGTPAAKDSEPRYHLRAWVRRTFALFLVLFSIFHAGPAMEAASHMQSGGMIFAYSLLWILLILSLGAAGLGLLGVRSFGKYWRQLALIGSICSIVFMVGASQPARTTLVILDVLIFVAAFTSRPYEPDPRRRTLPIRLLSGLVKGTVIASMVYGATVAALRPWYSQWGARPDEISKVLPGDEQARSRQNFINHVISIDAPPERVWAWLVQIGQDKAGFYSYDWLERAIGDDVHNRFELRPEWQAIKAGDAIHATQAGYLGGLFGNRLSWHVVRLEPNRMMQLDKWGTFWLEKLPDGGTRLGVRSPVGELPFTAAPFEVFVFEPAHFIMEQRMLRTLKELSEKQS